MKNDNLLSNTFLTYGISLHDAYVWFTADKMASLEAKVNELTQMNFNLISQLESMRAENASLRNMNSSLSPASSTITEPLFESTLEKSLETSSNHRPAVPPCDISANHYVNVWREICFK